MQDVVEVIYIMDDIADDFDEAIDEVINEVCDEDEKSKIKRHMLIIIHLIILLVGCFKFCTNSNTEKGF